jgi:tetratricopeptide (TPR) repeat protein
MIKAPIVFLIPTLLCSLSALANEAAQVDAGPAQAAPKGGEEKKAPPPKDNAEKKTPPPKDPEAAKTPPAKDKEDKKPPPKEKVSPEEKAARALFAKGQVAFKERNFKVALDHFQEAYEIMKLPQLLFNIAQCKAHLGDHDDAIVLYDQYLWEMGGAGDVAMAHKLIEESQFQLSKRHDSEGRETLRRKLAVMADEEAALKAQIEELQNEPPPPQRDWIFWTVLIGGSTLAVAGAAAVGLSFYCEAEGAPGLAGCF